MLDIIWARTGYRNVKQCVADYYEADDELLERDLLILCFVSQKNED